MPGKRLQITAPARKRTGQPVTNSNWDAREPASHSNSTALRRSHRGRGQRLRILRGQHLTRCEVPIHVAAPRAGTRRKERTQLTVLRRRPHLGHTQMGRGATIKVPYNNGSCETRHITAPYLPGPLDARKRGASGVGPRHVLLKNAGDPSLTERVIVTRLRRLAAGADQRRTDSRCKACALVHAPLLVPQSTG